MTINPDILDNAANYIEQNGWHRGYFYDMDAFPIYEGNIVQAMHQAAESSTPPMCTMGAIAVNASTIVEYFDIEAYLSRELGMQTNIPTWNDNIAGSKEEVIDFLRMTALKIRMGNIGDNPREYEFEPMPASEPVTEPAAPQPTKEPQPA